jgi:hypothetical protein
MQNADPKFERAFVAISFLLGSRDIDGAELGSAEARALVAALGRASREVRAAVLAKELAPIALALEQGNLRWAHDWQGT